MIKKECSIYIQIFKILYLRVFEVMDFINNEKQFTNHKIVYAFHLHKQFFVARLNSLAGNCEFALYEGLIICR